MPYTRYGESVHSVMQALDQMRDRVERVFDPEDLQKIVDSGSARNAIDCALWDLKAKTTGRAVEEWVDLPCVREFITMRTVVLDRPNLMAQAAATYPHGTPLKIKLDREQILERLAAVHAAVPDAPLVADPNESWNPEILKTVFSKLPSFGVVLLEQPLPQDHDNCLSEMNHCVPVCADESCRTSQDVRALTGRYDAINIKLDKTGGLTEAIALLQAARREGLQVMVGCLVGSALAIAPAALLAGSVDYIDLDGPLLLAKNHGDGMEEIVDTSRVRFTHPWGKP